MNYLHLTPSFVFTHLFKHENCESWFKFHFKWWKNRIWHCLRQLQTTRYSSDSLDDGSSRLEVTKASAVSCVTCEPTRGRRATGLVMAGHGELLRCFFLWEIWDHKTENTWNKNNNEITYIDIYIYICRYIYIYNNISWDFEGWITLISPMKSFKIWASEQGIKVGAESVSER